MAVEAMGLLEPGALATYVTLGLAVFVFSLDPGRRLNQLLACLLFIEGVMRVRDFLLGGVAWKSTVWPTWFAAGLNGVFDFAFFLLAPLYLIFIGQAIPIPATRILAAPRMQGAVILFGVGLWFAFELALASGQAPLRPWRGWYMFMSVLAAGLFGLFAAYRRYKTTPADSPQLVQAKIYLGAFGLRDVGLGLLMAHNAIYRSVELPKVVTEGVFLIFALTSLAYVLILTYAISKYRILGLDFGIRWTIGKGAVGAVVIGTYFIISELAAYALESRTQSRMAGILGAGLLLVFVAPLLAWGELLAGRVLPDAHSLAAMSQNERIKTYREQATIAWEDGKLSSKERRLLDASRSRLGLEREEASRIEETIVGALGPVSRQGPASRRAGRPL